ncbi:unnamed protein product, partial [Amoebophrya sp. A120]|eukprot:GSA120T00002261001.1
MVITLFAIVTMYLGLFQGPHASCCATSAEYTIDLQHDAGANHHGIAKAPGSDSTRSTNSTSTAAETQTGSEKSLQWSGSFHDASLLFDRNWPPALDAPQYAFPQDGTHREHSFVSLLAIWFPAVTGFEAGSNRSADLHNPSRDIPVGTFIAYLLTAFIYVSFAILYAGAAPRQTLLDDKFFAATATWPARECVVYGVMASTLGAGLSSLVSGTRLLAAIASDGTLPALRFFAPRRAPVATKSGKEVAVRRFFFWNDETLRQKWSSVVTLLLPPGLVNLLRKICFLAWCRPAVRRSTKGADHERPASKHKNETGTIFVGKVPEQAQAEEEGLQEPPSANGATPPQEHQTKSKPRPAASSRSPPAARNKAALALPSSRINGSAGPSAAPPTPAPAGEPYAALACCGTLCAAAIGVGELNVVASVLTMFFLMCYVCVNLSCAILSYARDPNWRPKFR